MNKFFTITLVILGFNNQANSQNKLKEGTQAPSFTVTDVSGKTVSLPNSDSTKTFLAFMRYAGCPVCNYRMFELRETYDSLKALGYELIVIYESSDSLLSEYLKDDPVPFSVIGDPERVLYKKYGVKRSGWKTFLSGFRGKTYRARRKGTDAYKSKKPERDAPMTGIPADFIISSNGTIESAYYGKSISDHMPLKEILN